MPAQASHLVRLRASTRRNHSARGSGTSSSASSSNARVRGKPWGTCPASLPPPHPRLRSGGAPGAASCCRAQASAASLPAGPRLLCCGKHGGGSCDCWMGAGAAAPPLAGTALLLLLPPSGTSNSSRALRLEASRRAGPCSCWRRDCRAGVGSRAGQQAQSLYS